MVIAVEACLRLAPDCCSEGITGLGLVGSLLVVMNSWLSAE